MVMTESFACLQKMAEGLAEVNPALGLLVPLPSGYDEEFVGDVEDECTCSICFLPLREPVLTRCGHRFCKSCLEEHFRRCAFSL